ncbi:hypothetical protein [Bdellovibrio sp. HCB337]|uniref:hypothetical protein n=1 Tax=Bdellovibrio sp. HCB337 TaxID=3394358 RepID=UPI0039A46CF6
MRILKRFVFILFAGGLCAGIAFKILWVQVDPNKASTVISAIHQRGANWILTDSWKDPKSWEQILKNIETGLPEWIEVYSLLAPETKGKGEKEIIAAVSKALLKNPDLVLKTIASESSPFGIEKICGRLSDDELEFLDEGVDALKAQMASVNRVAEPELLSAKEKCLGQIRYVLAREIFREDE